MLEILYQDEYIVAINKPNGLLVHKTRIAEEKKEFAVQQLRDQLGQRVYPLHRLDRKTSGVLLFALSSEVANAFRGIFENHQIQKRYLAILRGYIDDAGVIDHPIKDENKTEAQDAVTHFKRLATTELSIPVGPYETARYSLVEAKPLSGRRHQIRKHFRHLRHPIIGDKQYGDRYHNAMFINNANCQNLLLHAHQVTFTHPIFDEEINITATLPDFWHQMFDFLNWKDLDIAIINN